MRTLEEMIEDEECLRYLETMPEEEIDFSDIPEVTDWTGWRRADGRPVVVPQPVAQ